LKVLYFNQFFKTPKEGGSIRPYLLIKELLKKNVSVVMITSHNGPNKKVVIDGIEVIYLHVPYQNEYKFWQRIYSYSLYTLKAIWASLKQPQVDLCYIMTTPLATGFIGLTNKLLKRRPYIFEIGDLWPLVPIEMGFIKSSFLKKITTWLEKIFYKNAIGNIGLSHPITHHIKKIAANTPTTTVYNISDCKFFTPTEKSQLTLAKYGIKDNEFVISYTGTFGLANDLARLIQLASQVKQLPIKFILVGSGADKPKLEQLSNGLNNLSIIDYLDKKGIQDILSITDAMLISFANHPSLWTGSPNKLFDALAAGKLVISNFEGWVSHLLYDNECGFSFSHDSISSFEYQIMPFLEDKTLLKAYQENARSLAEQKFELTVQAKKQYKFINQCLTTFHS